MDDGPLLQILENHTNEVTTCDISVCNVLATGSSDKTVRVWEWRSGLGFTPAPFSPLPPHKYGVTWVRFSPQGTMLLSASVDGTSVLWNARTGARVRTLVQATRCSVRRCEFTPDSSQVVTAGDDGTFCFWDLLHGTLLRSCRLHDEEDSCVLGLAVSPDSELLLSGDTGGLLKLWRLSGDDMECLNFTKNVNDGVTACAFSPIRSLQVIDEVLISYHVVTTGCDGRILLWEVKTVRRNCKSDFSDIAVCDMLVVSVFEGHTSDVHDVRFNSVGTLLSSTGLDKVVNVWKVEDGSCTSTLIGHTRYGNCCVFNKDSTILVSGSNDRTAIVWDLAGGTTLHSDLAPACVVSSHFSTESNTEGSEALLTQHAEEVDDRLELLQVIENAAAVNSCCFGAAEQLAVAGGEKIIRLWERQPGDVFVEGTIVTNHSYSINYVDISPCGSRLISCAMDGLLVHSHLQMGLTSELRNSAVTNSLRACCFSTAGDLIAAGGDDEIVFLWDAASLEFIRTAQEHRDAVTGVAFSPDNLLLASCCCAGDVILFDVDRGETVHVTDNAHDLGATSCAFATDTFTPDNEVPEEGDHLLASCGNDSLIKLWLVNGSSLRLVSQLVGHGGNVAQVRFSATLSHILVSAATDNTARIWNAKNGECIYVVEHHESLANSVALSRDNTLLATGSMDKTVAIWRVPETLLYGAGAKNVLHLHKRVQGWTAGDVAHWFADFDYSAAAASAETADLSGSELLALTESEIADRLELDGEERKNVEQLLWWLKQESAGSVLQVADRDVPHQFLCPITHDIMVDPVLCSDGFTYERAAILEWLAGGRSTSPMTNEPLREASIRTYPSLKLAIYKFLYGVKEE